MKKFFTDGTRTFHGDAVLEAQGIDTNQADNFIEVGFFLKDFHGGSSSFDQSGATLAS